MKQAHSVEWIHRLARAGWPGAVPLAAGVEGAVYTLPDGLVAKVWAPRASLGPLRDFYAELAGAGLPFRTPEFVHLYEDAGQQVTVERLLPGGPASDPFQLVPVLSSLASVRPGPAAYAMPVLLETAPFRTGRPFIEDFLALLDRRAAASASLRARVPGFDRLVTRLMAELAALEPLPDAPLHGDLCAENLLAAPDGRVLSVLDFGFLTTAGDPRLDAAITASTYDMYGPADHVPAVACGLGYDERVLRLYTCAYAICVANVFTASGDNDHARWCAEKLRAGW